MDKNRTVQNRSKYTKLEQPKIDQNRSANNRSKYTIIEQTKMDKNRTLKNRSKCHKIHSVSNSFSASMLLHLHRDTYSLKGAPSPTPVKREATLTEGLHALSA